MAADGGACVLGGITADQEEKRIAGSRWRLMVGVCFLGGTADQEGKNRGRSETKKKKRLQ